jgi:putative ABC transport system permease protein
MWKDLRFALRTFGRQPSFATVIVITVALGIGGSTAVFSVLNAVLIRDLPYQDADRLYIMRVLAPDGLPGNITRREFAPIYEQEDHPIVEAATIVWSQESQIAAPGQQAQPTVRYGVTDGFFNVFRTQMALGRGFESSDRTASIVVSYPVWRDVFQSDPDIIGKSVTAEGMTLPVVGVTPPDFDFPEDPGFWYLMRIGAAYDNVRAYRGFVRLRPDRTIQQFEGDLVRLGNEIGLDPVTNQTPRLVADSMLEYVVGDLKPTVLMLFGATGILLLIACINITNLLLSRTTVRSREMAVREAVGAGRWRIIRQLLTESLLLTLAGGVLGLALAAGASRALLAIGPAGLPRLDAVPMDATVLLFAAGTTLFTGLLVGLAPAWRLARNELRSLMNESGRGTPGGAGRHRTFSVLVVTEIALAVVLVIGAGLLVRSYVNLMLTNPGFDPDRVLTVSMNVPGRLEGGSARMVDGRRVFDRSPYAPVGTFFRDLGERLGGLAGVEAVASTTLLPLTGDQAIVSLSFTLPDQPGSGAGAAFVAPAPAVSPDFFGAMDMRILRGRPFSWSDREGAPGVAIVNETFARRFLRDQDPLGHRIRWHTNRYVPGDTGFQFGHLMVEEVEVVGVVADAKYLSLAQPAEPAIYVSSEQFIHRRRALVVRTSGDDPGVMVSAIRREIDAIDPLVGTEFAVYASTVSDSIARERLGMALLVSFGVIALLLAAIGVYGLMSYSVAQRSGEMALRSALGSSAGQVLRLVMGQGIRLACAGVAVGVVGAVVLRQAVASQLYGVTALDPPVFLGVIAVLFGVAALACYVPARRATRVDPADLLRTE